VLALNGLTHFYNSELYRCLKGEGANFQFSLWGSVDVLWNNSLNKKCNMCYKFISKIMLQQSCTTKDNIIMKSYFKSK
jgi:hypothetical protein